MARETDEAPHPQAVARQEARWVKAWRARIFLAGGVALGCVALWKLVTVETDPILWVMTAAAGFGLASIESIVTAVKK